MLPGPLQTLVTGRPPVKREDVAASTSGSTSLLVGSAGQADPSIMALYGAGQQAASQMLASGGPGPQAQSTAPSGPPWGWIAGGVGALALVGGIAWIVTRKPAARSNPGKARKPSIHRHGHHKLQYLYSNPGKPGSGKKGKSRRYGHKHRPGHHRMVYIYNNPGARPIRQIALEIKREWKKPYFGAVPYLDALLSLDAASDYYMNESARSIILYFLSNASAWRGDAAKRLKAELRAHLR